MSGSEDGARTTPEITPAGRPALDPDQVKHLEFVQSVIARLSNNSFLVKGWTLTLAGALLAFATSDAGWPAAGTALISLVAFWFLDGYFLYRERLFRMLYDDVRRPARPEAARPGSPGPRPDGPGHTPVEPFSMDLTPYAHRTRWHRAAFSTTLSLFYGGLAVAHLVVLVAVLLN
ncbi:hypothetical protein ACWEJP_16680 [Streptomyces sp. NPDC004749]